MLHGVGFWVNGLALWVQGLLGGSGDLVSR